MTIVTKAIVVSRRPDRQDDCLVTCITQKMGIVYARARSAYKLQSKLKGHLEPGKEVEVMIDTKGTIKTLAQATTIKTLLSHHPRTARVQGALIQTVLQIMQEPDMTLYEVMVDMLEHMKQCYSIKQLYGTLAESLLMCARIAGFGIHTSSCVNCDARSAHSWFISYEAGGFVCSSCAGILPAYLLSPAIMKGCSQGSAAPIALPHIISHIQWHANKKMTHLRAVCAVDLCVVSQ